jgi:hypothetical protein
MEDTITLTEENPNTVHVPTPATASTNQVRLTDIEIVDENMALNVIVSFLGVAQQRGTFSIAESAKIYECIQKFVNKTNDTNA